MTLASIRENFIREFSFLEPSAKILSCENFRYINSECHSHGLTVNSSKALHNDSHASQVAWLQGSVLPATAFTVVVLPEHDPGHTLGLMRSNTCSVRASSMTYSSTPATPHLVVPSSVWHTAVLPCQLVPHFIGFIVLGIYSTKFDNKIT